jgi:hypothetical protein
MPLKQGQEDLILAMISTTLDLPTNDAKQLSTEISRINYAFTHDDYKKDDGYPFIQKPEIHLPGLEGYRDSKSGQPSDKLKMGHVKLHLLKLFNEKIVSSAKLAGLPLTLDIWNAARLRERISESKDFNSDFVTRKPRADEMEPPYSIYPDEGQIYKGRMTVDPENFIVSLQLEISNLSENPQTKKLIHSELPEFKNDEKGIQQHNYLLQAASTVNIMADNAVSEEVLNYLLSLKLITQSEHSSAGYDNILLTYKTYLDLLKEEKISYADICHLSLDQIISLKQPAIRELITSGKATFHTLKGLTKGEVATLSVPGFRDLIENDISTFEEIAKLSVEQKIVASHSAYGPAIKSGELPLEKIQKLTDDECKKMYWPAAVNLYQKNKIKLNQIIGMTEGTKLIIADSFYGDELLKNRFHFSEVEYLDQLNADVLLLPEIKSLIQDGLTTIGEMSSLPYFVKNNLISNPLIKYLVANNLLQINKLSLLSHNEFNSSSLFAPIKKMEEKQLNQFRVVINEFIDLAAVRLVSYADLRYLYENFTEIHRVLGKNKIDSKETIRADGNTLLACELMMKRCKVNLNNRITSVLRCDPILYGDMEDSIEMVISDCHKYNIDINAIFKKLLDNEILDYQVSSLVSQEHLFALMRFAKKIGISKEKTLERILGARLVAIFEQLPQSDALGNDSMKRLLNDIHVIAVNLNISTMVLMAGAIQYLLLTIKAQLLDSKLKNHPICSEIVKDIQGAEHANADSKSVGRPHVWLDCFKLVVSHLPKKPVEVIKKSLVLFPGKHVGDNEKGIQLFRDKLASIADFVGYENMLDSKYESKHKVAFSKK